MCVCEWANVAIVVKHFERTVDWKSATKMQDHSPFILIQSTMVVQRLEEQTEMVRDSNKVSHCESMSLRKCVKYVTACLTCMQSCLRIFYGR